MDETLSEQVMQRLRALKPRFSEMGIERMRVFGSVVRGDMRPDSDVDLIVDIAGSPTYFDLIDIQERLEKNLSKKVDLITPGGIHPALKDKILSEARDV